MKKKGRENMGAFIEQVQRNNQIQNAALTEKQRKAKEKQQKDQEKEDYKIMQKDCIMALDNAIMHTFKLAGSYENGLTTLHLIDNKNAIINHVGTSYVEREYMEQIYYKEVDKIGKQYKLDEKSRQQIEENKKIEEYKKEQTRIEDIKAYRESKNPALKYWNRLKNDLPSIFKILNIITNILLIPFIILFGIIGLLTSAGIKESKKNNKW